VTRRTPKTHTLAAAAAFAGVLQLVATLELSLSSDAAVIRAAREGPKIYLVAAASLAASGAVVAWQRHRPLRVRLAMAAPGLVAAIALLYFGGTQLGLAYYGERLLHHFLACLCAAACVSVTLTWGADRSLGRLRLVPAVPATLGASLLLAEHLSRAAQAPISLVGQVGAACLLASPPLAAAALWRHLQPPAMRLAALALMLPLTLRVALDVPAALSGMPLGTEAAAPLLAAVGLAGLVCAALARPRAERGLHGAALAIAGVACLALHRGYTKRFGEFEGALGALTRSLLGFQPPYPGYLPGWWIAAGLLALFAVFALATTSLLSRCEHVRGLCLVILLCAGLGLSSPQLVLMAGAGLLLSLDTLAGAPAPAPRVVAPARPLEAITAEAAELLGLPPPTVLEQERGAVIALRGELGRVPVELRARQERGDWAVVLQAGVLGRGAPDVELLPGAPGAQPHPLAAGHRVRGEPRRLELLPESFLTALAAFPEHRTRVWAGGCQVDLGGRLDRLDPEALAAVLRGMAEAA
jgi:hypothetical protein